MYFPRFLPLPKVLEPSVPKYPSINTMKPDTRPPAIAEQNMTNGFTISQPSRHMHVLEHVGVHTVDIRHVEPHRSDEVPHHPVHVEVQHEAVRVVPAVVDEIPHVVVARLVQSEIDVVLPFGIQDPSD